MLTLLSLLGLLRCWLAGSSVVVIDCGRSRDASGDAVRVPGATVVGQSGTTVTELHQLRPVIQTAKVMNRPWVIHSEFLRMRPED
jgi:hypothetical protein